MITPQTGIFALGDASQIYLECHLSRGASARALVERIASFHEPRSTVGGVNFVVGFKPELWREVAPNDTPDDAKSFEKPMRGPDGFEMPATQADLWLWFAGASYDICWENARDALRYLNGLVTVATETAGWPYRHSRDLTGFEDGTENPNLLDAPQAAIVPEGQNGQGGSILLYQLWRHENTWLALSDDQQEQAMGRTKVDSVEFEEGVLPEDSHVARAKDVVNGEERKIFRRNVPYGNVGEYGTVFVGFSCEQSRLVRMLVRMAGIEDGIRDALTRHTTPLTGAFYVIPSVQALKKFSTDRAG
ncbi:MAG: Dyp-type peroxidase [Candidatus Baltobacteraceae bacterium]